MSLLKLLSDNKPTEVRDDIYTDEVKINILINEIEMVFSSRSCFSYIEDINLINTSILNYGIDETVLVENIYNQQFDLIEKYIEKTLLRYEPRLVSVVVAIQRKTMFNVYIEISAWYEKRPIEIMLNWDIERRRFYFNE